MSLRREVLRPRRHLLAWVAFAEVMLAMVASFLLAAACTSKDPAPVPQVMGFGSFGMPLSGGAGAPVTSFVGVIDPTNTAFRGGMTTCTSACSAGLAEANRAALQSAVDAAALQRKSIYIPPGQYPIGRKSAVAYGVDFGGDADVFIDGVGVTLRQTGDATSTAFAMFYVRNVSRVRFRGITFSQRDVTNSTADTVAMLIGDAGVATVNDVTIEDCAFVEGVGGDYVRMDGGSSALTITQVNMTRNRYETAVGAAIDVRPGTQRVVITYSFFKNNAGRDIYFEPLTNNLIGQFEIIGNSMDRTSSTSAQSVTLSGYSAGQRNEASQFSYNRVIGGVVEGVNLTRAHLIANFIEYPYARGATALIELTGGSSDDWINDNYLNRQTGATNGNVIKVASVGSDTPTNVTVRGNRIYQFAGSSQGINFSGASRIMVLDNKITYHASTADSGATGFAGVYCAGTSAAACSGLIARNSVKKDDQDIRASLSLGTVTTNVDTVVESLQIGTYGNSITVRFVGDSGATAGSIAETGTACTIHYRPAFTTVTGIQTLIASSGLIRVKTAGTGAHVLQATVDAFGPTNLAGGVAAGRMLAGIEVLVGTGTTINRLTARDNVVDGSANSFYIDGNGSAAYPEGYPVISGTFGLSVAAEISGGMTTYRTETSSDAEVITTGALAIAKSISFVTTSGTKAYTLADGVRDGQVHYVKIYTATSTPAGTLTPTSYTGNGGTTITWNGTGWFQLQWDATAAKWRPLGSGGSVTVN